MKRKIFGSCLGTVALLAAALLIARPDLQAAPQEDNKEVSKLLEDIKMQAADLRHDSDLLEGYTEPYASWETHAADLERMKDRINAIGKTISKLQELRSSASPWQQEAIDRIIPVAQKLASNTTAAIEHLNKDPLKVHSPQYQAVRKVQCGSCGESRRAGERLRGIWQDADHFGSIRTQIGSPKIKPHRIISRGFLQAG